ncbi:MAG TPA: hypothetical protein VMP67_06420, partial [Candidatus Limnocylindria bacterium]|nr:hypothetical protein [Candidatus Limnocylindria bacterium]
MATRAARSSRTLRRSRRPGSLASPVLRHALVFAWAAAASYWLTLSGPVAQPLLLWLAGAVVVGLLAGAVGRTWLGMPFLVLGSWLGVLLGLQFRAGSGVEALNELSGTAAWLAAFVAVLLVAYVGG